MAGDDERALVGLQGTRQLPHAGQVEVVRRLVQQKQLRGGGGEHRRREGGPEAFAARQGARRLLRAGPLEEEPGELGADLVVGGARGGAGDVVRDAQRVVEDVQPLREELQRHRRRGLPGARCELPREHPQQGRLAGPVAADQGDAFGSLHLEAALAQPSVGEAQVPYGQDGAARGYGGVGQAHLDLGVPANGFGGLLPALAGLVEPVLVQAAQPVPGLLGRALAFPGDDARGLPLAVQLLVVALAAGHLDPGLLQFALLAAYVGVGGAQHPPGGLLLGREGLLVGGPAAPVPADRARPQFGDAVDPLKQVPVVADDDQDPGAPGVDGVVEPAAGEQVQVVGRLVEEEDVRAFQEQRGQAQQDGLPAGQLPDGAVQFDGAEPEGAEGGQGALLDVPVVADRLEVLLPYVSGLDGTQGGPALVDAEGRVDAQGGVQGDVLGQVGKVSADRDGPLGGAQQSGEQAQQGRLAGAVGSGQTGAAPGDGEGETVEEVRAVGPPEGEVGGCHGGAGRGGMAHVVLAVGSGRIGGLRMRTARGDPARGRKVVGRTVLRR